MLMRNPLQLVLDFFSAPVHSAPQVPPAPRARQRQKTTSPAPPQPSSVQIRADGDAHLPVWSHPKANRETVVQGVRVAYIFQRVRRRSIGFLVGPDGLEVRAPKWVTLKDIEAALQERAEWVLRKWAEVQVKQQNIRQIEWREGAFLDYLGQPIALRLCPENGRTDYCDNEEGGAQLRLALPQHALPAQIRDAVQAWLMRQARSLFEDRLNHFAPRMGVQWRKLSLSNASSRWGSARVDGAIRLNWRLVHLQLDAIDYVVVHELAHLQEMNHSPAFWKIVEIALPDYDAQRKQLQKENLANWG